MKLQNIFLIVFSLFVTQLSFAQNYKSDFEKLLKENDTINQLKLLKNWEKVEPENAELFTSYFNYYLLKSRKEKISLTSQKSSDKSYLLKDSLNKNSFYLGNKFDFRKSDIQKGFEKIDEGIKLYPNRLDMRFGKIFVFGEIKDWSNFTKEILATIDYSTKNNNDWIDNEKNSKGKTFFLQRIHNFQVQLYRTNDESLLKNMQEIANEVLKFYPDHVESLSNLSITYILKKEYDKGLIPLLKAEKINPKDVVVLSNIAQCYTKKGDKKSAIEYYEKMMEFGNANAAAFAKHQIEELQK